MDATSQNLIIKAFLYGLIQILLFSFLNTSFAGTCPDGMIANWRLGESSQPYQNSVQTTSGTDAACAPNCPAPSEGVVAGATQFEAQNDTGLQIPGTAFNWNGADSFSIELWLKINRLPSDDQVLIGRTDGVFNWNLSIGNTGNIRFYMDDSQNSLLLESAKELSTETTALGPRWHHVAVTRSGISGEVRLYVDDRPPEIDTAEFQGDFSSDEAPLSIGWSGNETNPQRFSGNLDEIAVYQRALDENEILGHYYLARNYCEMYDYPINIMPLGNSITFDRFRDDIVRSDGERTGYRYPLWQSLLENHYWFDFVGSQRAGYDVNPEFDPDNAGFPGISPSQMITLLQDSVNTAHGADIVTAGGTRGTSYLDDYTVDMILLHIGTNGLSLDNVAHVATILDEIDRYSPLVTVIVARIIHRTDDYFNGTELPDNLTHLYNEQLMDMVDDRIADGDKLIKVDMEDGAGLLYRDEASGEPYYTGEDMEDDLHPNASGYAKMAAQWFTRLQAVLPRVTLPKITSQPNPTAVANQPYQYLVAADGTPKPNFRLEKGPDGMTIDSDSGLITWNVPNTAGQTVNVSVTAHQNLDPAEVTWASEDSQEFSIQINAQSPPKKNGDSGGGCFLSSIDSTRPLTPLVNILRRISQSVQ